MTYSSQNRYSSVRNEEKVSYVVHSPVSIIKLSVSCSA